MEYINSFEEIDDNYIYITDEQFIKDNENNDAFKNNSYLMQLLFEVKKRNSENIQHNN